MLCHETWFTFTEFTFAKTKMIKLTHLLLHNSDLLKLTEVIF